MRLKSFYFFAVGGMLLLSGACSTKKDKFLNRNFHAMTTKFNVLYNGNLAFDEGYEALTTGYQDNFWEILPVERLDVNEDAPILLPGRQTKNPNFEIAEEKAAKAIQKHSMNIAGSERNPQMDEAFILLGKARYFDQRFIPALEAFNYILYKYPNSDKINTAKIWREKVNIRLNNEQIAIRNLNRLLKTEILDKQEYADLHAFMAQAYLNRKINDTALIYLKEAAFTTSKNHEKARYLFIMGQLYENLQVLDSSDLAFNEILRMKRKAPRMYWAHAQLKIAEHYSLKDGNDHEELATLMKLAENRESRPYLDKIYYQIGQFHDQREAVALAEVFYNKALSRQTPDDELKARVYQALGNIYFNKNEYFAAGQYYDSTLTHMNPNTLAHFRLKRRRDNLQDVIKYEEISAVNDSILNLVSLSEEDREAVFQTVIDTLKARAIAAREAAKEQEALMQDRESFLGLETNQRQAASAFQFYETTLMASQRLEFKRRWGNRNLADNWRWQDRVSAMPQPGVSLAENPEEAFTDSIYQLTYYLSKIPKAPKVIDSLTRQRDDAYYQLGLLYKERFQAYAIAAEKLEILLANAPEEKLILPAKFNLYQIYAQLGDEKADRLRNEILTQYPDSRFSVLLNNPQAELEADDESPEAFFTRIYKMYQNQQFATVEKQLDSAVLRFNGDEMVPRFLLLKARTTARLDGLLAYKKQLEEISLDYANMPEGKEAARLLAEDFSSLENSEFDFETPSLYWKLLVPYAYADTLKMKENRKVVEKAIEDLKYDYLFLSEDVYNRDTLFFVIHGFPNPSRAEGFAELLEVNKDYKLKLNTTVVNSENYRIIQIHKNFDAYFDEMDRRRISNKN